MKSTCPRTLNVAIAHCDSSARRRSGAKATSSGAAPMWTSFHVSVRYAIAIRESNRIVYGCFFFSPVFVVGIE